MKKIGILLSVGNNLPVDTALTFELFKIISLPRKKELCVHVQGHFRRSKVEI